MAGWSSVLLKPMEKYMLQRSLIRPCKSSRLFIAGLPRCVVHEPAAFPGQQLWSNWSLQIQTIGRSFHTQYYMQLRRFMSLINWWWYPVLDFHYKQLQMSRQFDTNSAWLCPIYIGCLLVNTLHLWLCTNSNALDSSMVVKLERWSSIDDRLKLFQIIQTPPLSRSLCPEIGKGWMNPRYSFRVVVKVD